MNQCKTFIKQLGFARGVIVAFTVLLFVLAFVKDLQMGQLISDCLSRFGRHGILVLSLLPFVKGGLGLNFGLPVGVLCGLVGVVFSINLNLAGYDGLAVALAVGGGLGIVIGLFYGWLLNKVKGQEMVVGTYVGFASVSFMCLAWMMLPFNNPTLVWSIAGKGLRMTIPMDDTYGRILDNLWSFTVGDIWVPTGLILSFLVACILVALFFKTRHGMAIIAAGQNEKFAIASSIKPNRTRLLATTLSTFLGAIGIVIYSQSYGFVQLYTAPLMIAFPIVACILIGGAGIRTATMFHVIFGCLVFQSLLTVALPVANEFIGGDITEAARIVISNGIILYALVGVGAQK